METPQAAGEEVIWSGSVSNWHYSGRWILALLLFAGLVATFFAPVPVELTSIIARGILLGLALVIVIWIQLDRSRRKYAITGRRVSAEYGIISKNSKEMRIEDIRSINLTTTGVSGLLGIGRVEFSASSEGEDDVVFWHVSGAKEIRDRVRALQTRNS